MKRSILYFSDCPFFAGCENMLANFLNDPVLRERYRIAFLYRGTPGYEEGFRKRVGTGIEATPVHLYDHFAVYAGIDSCCPKFLRKPLKILTGILLVKYIFLVANTVILIGEIRGREIDLVHINSGGYPGAYSSYAMLIAARLCRIPNLVFVANNVAAGYRSPERWGDLLLDRCLVRRLPIIFVTGSTFAGRELARVLGISPSRVLTIPNGIAPRPVTESREGVMVRLDLPRERMILSVIAVLEERKGHIHLLRALKELLTRYPGEILPFCIIEGSGPEEETLKRFVRENGLHGDVRFIAHEEQIFSLISASDCIVLPSVRNEDFPNIVLEAMSLGKTVIASRFSGIPEQIEDGISGILVDPGDSHGLAMAIRRVRDEPEIRQELGARAKQRFEELFTDKKSMEHYQELYTRILKEA